MSLDTISFLWLAYFTGGLILLISVSYRQFNEPHWLVEDESSIRTLPPSDLVEARRFRWARALYVAFVVVAFALLCTVPPLLTVLLTMFNMVANSGITAGEAGGDLPLLPPTPADNGAGLRQAAEVEIESATFAARVEAMQARAEFPFILALGMIAAMRLPMAQRLESWLRWFAQDSFGIPTLPETLHNRLVQMRLPVEELDVDLDAEPGAEPIRARAASFADSAHEVLGEVVSRTALTEQLIKIFAYRVWVRDFRVWPSPNVFPSASSLARWNKRLLADIVALQQDLTLLTGDDFPWEMPGLEEEKAQAMKRMRGELWQRCIAEVERLAGEVCALIVLIDQRSHRPPRSRPTAAALHRLLGELHEEDQDNSPMFGRILSLMALAPAICFGAGALLALGWRRIALNLQEPPTDFGSPDFSWLQFGRNYDVVHMGTHFAISGLTVYGIAVLVGGLWIGGGGRDGARRGAPKTPVTIRVLGIFLACFGAVLIAYTVQGVLVAARSEGWDAIRMFDWVLREEVQSAEIIAALGQAMLGGLFGTMVATLSFARVRRRSLVGRLAIGVLFLVLMAFFGRLIGLYAIPYNMEATQMLHGQIYMGLAAVMALLAILVLLPRRRRVVLRDEVRGAPPASAGIGAVGAHAP